MAHNEQWKGKDNINNSKQSHEILNSHKKKKKNWERLTCTITEKVFQSISQLMSMSIHSYFTYLCVYIWQEVWKETLKHTHKDVHTQRKEEIVGKYIMNGCFPNNLHQKKLIREFVLTKYLIT